MLRKRIFSFMIALVFLALVSSLAFARDWSEPLAQSGMGMETATAAPDSMQTVSTATPQPAQPAAGEGETPQLVDPLAQYPQQYDPALGPYGMMGGGITGGMTNYGWYTNALTNTTGLAMTTCPMMSGMDMTSMGMTGMGMTSASMTGMDMSSASMTSMAMPSTTGTGVAENVAEYYQTPWYANPWILIGWVLLALLVLVVLAGVAVGGVILVRRSGPTQTPRA
jgi:hypothetical protein